MPAFSFAVIFATSALAGRLDQDQAPASLLSEGTSVNPGWDRVRG
jgi:hypothetical protein